MDSEPLDFRQTLDQLAAWAGRNVLVTAHSRPPGQPLSHAHTVLRGPLGELEMVDTAVDSTVESIAAYSVGSAPNGLYMGARDLVHGIRRGPNHLTIEFHDGFHFEIRLLG